MPDERDIFQICVDEPTGADLEFLLIGGQAVNARGYERTTLDIDFLIAARNLRAWSSVLERAGYRLLPVEGGIKAFAQFEPRQGEGFRVDLMLVEDGTFAKLIAGSEWLVWQAADTSHWGTAPCRAETSRPAFRKSRRFGQRLRRCPRASSSERG